MRKPISKRLRFEVFKRDQFTCQYCGVKAPDVVLHVDHINPVAAGGDNDILNLITSCAACNNGKGARQLSDASEIEKQREQLEELSERREQLEAMIQWRDEMRGLTDDALKAIVDDWDSQVYPFRASEIGISNLRKLIKKFGFEILTQAIEAAVERYVKFDDRGATGDSVDIAFDRLGGICYYLTNPDKDDMKDVFYIRAILRNRLSYINERMAVVILKELRELGANMEMVKEFAQEVRSWTEFRDAMQDRIIEGRERRNEQ